MMSYYNRPSNFVVVCCLVVLFGSLSQCLAKNTCVLGDSYPEWFSSSPKIQSGTACALFNTGSCCLPEYSERILNHTDIISGPSVQLFKEPISSGCQSKITKLSCLFCPSGQANFLQKHSWGLSVRVCEAECKALYSNCKNDMFVDEEVVSDVYADEQEFCHYVLSEAGFEEVTFDASESCYMSRRECKSSDYKWEYTACNEFSNTRDLIWFLNPDVICHGGVSKPANAYNLQCDIECEAGEYLKLGGETCLPCEAGSFSLGGGDKVGSWYEWPEQLNLKTYCINKITNVKDETCGWELNGESIHSGKTPDMHSSVLEMTIRFIREQNSSVAFRYAVSAEDGGFADFDGLEFYVDDVKLMPMVSSTEAFENAQFLLPPGLHTLQWVFTKDPLNAYGEDRAEIEFIQVSGNKKADDTCTPCAEGTFSASEGSDGCSPCPFGTATDEKHSTRCKPCSDDKFALAGSTSCSTREACSMDDVYYSYTDCVGEKRSREYQFLEPVICDFEHYELPSTEHDLECASCNPGSARADDGACHFCDPGSYSDGTEACQPALAGRFAPPETHFKNFFDWDKLPGLQTSCRNGCGSDGWRLDDDVIDSGVGHAKDAISELLLHVEVNQPGILSYNFSLSCETACQFRFVITNRDTKAIDGHLHVYTESSSFEEKVHYFTQPGNYTAHWEFTRLSSSTRGMYDRVKVSSILVTGTKDGHAGETFPCAAGTYSSAGASSCVPCGEGQFSQEGASECSYCNRNSFAWNGKCVACGHGTKAAPSSAQCDYETCMYNVVSKKVEDENLVYNLTVLRDLPDSPLPVSFSNRRYYLNVCRRSSSCTTKSGEPLGESFACQTVQNGESYDLGQRMSLYDYGNDEQSLRNGVTIQYDLGQIGCNNTRRKADIDFLCDPEAGIGAPAPATPPEPRPCEYGFVWRSLYGCPMCSDTPGVHYDSYFTSCQYGERKEVFYWNQSPKRCHGGAELPETRTLPCEFDKECDPGYYLKVVTNECAPCGLGNYCPGGELYDMWDVLPEAFTNLGWTLEGDVVASGDNSTQLWYSKNFVRNGTISFKVKIDSDNSRNARFEFLMDYRVLATLYSTKFKFKHLQFDVPKGFHSFHWKFYGGRHTSNGVFERAAEISHIAVVGGEFSMNIQKPCPDGYYQDKTGQVSCNLCPANHKCVGETVMPTPCEDNEYSPAGSSSCLPRPQCRAKDFVKVYTPCVDGVRDFHYKKLEPQICIIVGNAYDPSGLDETGVPCDVCPLGTYQKGKKCVACESGQYLNEENKCVEAEAGYAALKTSSFFTARDEPLPSNFSTDCSGQCGTDGWRMLGGSGIDSGFHRHFEVDSFFSFKAETDSAGEVTFTYDVKDASSSSGLMFFINDSPQKLDYHPSKKTTVSFPIGKHTSTFMWNYHHQPKSESDIHGRVIVSDVIISGTSNGGATQQTPCNKGTYSKKTGSSSCKVCPAGSFSGDEPSTSCEKCASNSFAPVEGSSSCKKCGSGTRASASRTQCESSCVFDIKENEEQIDLSPLVSGPVSLWNPEASFSYLYINLCSHFNETCTNSKGESVESYVCGVDYRGVGADAGSMLSVKTYPIGANNKGKTVQLTYSEGSYVPGCNEASTTVVSLYCPTDGEDMVMGAPVDVGSTSCHNQIAWQTSYACPLCTSKDYEARMGSCDDGKVLVFSRKKPGARCHGPAIASETEKSCSNDGFEFSTDIVLSAAAAFVALVVVLVIIFVKHYKLKSSYSLLIEERDDDDIEMDELDEAEIDE